MENRFKLGVLFYFDKSWMGGIIYIQNLIRTLDYLEDKDKPEITLFYRPGLKDFADEIEYPYIKKIEHSFPSIWKRYVISWLKGDNIFINEIVKNHSLNALFPLHDLAIKSKVAKKKQVSLISWFADLQHKHYPMFFSFSKRFFTELRLFFIKRNCTNLVLSSESVANDFYKYYQLKPTQINIFHFVSIIGPYKQDNFDELRIKYALPENYFIVSNQFHKHKNHKIIIEAIHALNEKGVKIHVAFTGKLPFDPKAAHLIEIHELIERFNLKSQITILGLMPRDEQLLLMKNAQAVIQPSFFEGWSTVVEDAMALNVPVIASNIPVNIEQLQSKGIYFDPKSTIDLVNAIVNFGKRDFSKDNFGNYDDRIKQAALNFMSIVKGEKKKRVLQINTSVNFGSSGRIVEEIAALGNHHKFENYIAYGKGVPGKFDITYLKIGNAISKIWHGLLTLLFDAHGRGSKLATKKLISKITTIAPDILHIHNLHGYYLNYPLLFKYIKERNLPVIWTLHDCWSFTGHCAHYENIGCQKWETKCHACPKRNKYPKSIYYDGSEYNYLNKKELFSGVSSMQIITPSNWLNLQVSKSFLAPYSVQTINNGVDLELFKENIAASLSLRQQYKLDGKKIALCVAYNWSNAKGIIDIIQVAKLLPDEFKFVIVGLSSNKITELPKDIIAIEKTNNLNDLVNWYSLADVFVNPTYMDTFPTTNIESLACGTPVITYKSGGSPEAINQDTGLVLEKGDIKGMSAAIQQIASKGKEQYKEACRKHAETNFDKNIQFQKYINLYNQVINNN